MYYRKNLMKMKKKKLDNIEQVSCFAQLKDEIV